MKSRIYRLLFVILTVTMVCSMFAGMLSAVLRMDEPLRITKEPSETAIGFQVTENPVGATYIVGDMPLQLQATFAYRSSSASRTVDSKLPITLERGTVEGLPAGSSVTVQWYRNALDSTRGSTLLSETVIKPDRLMQYSSTYTPVADTVGVSYYYAVLRYEEAPLAGKARGTGDVDEFVTDRAKIEVNPVPTTKTYTVVCVYNNGDPDAATSVLEGSKVPIPPDPNWEGYLFAGWYTDQNLTAVLDHNAVVVSDMTLYAAWVPLDALVDEVLPMSLPVPGLPANELPISKQIVLVFTIDSTSYTINGNPQQMDVAPVLIDGRTFLPTRYVTEPLGAVTDWDADERKVIITSGDKVVELWIDNPTFYINGEANAVDTLNQATTPIIIDGRTFMPMRIIAETLGYRVEWDGALMQAILTYPSV